MSGDTDPTGQPEAQSEFLDAMQQATDILTGKLAPMRVHAPKAPLGASFRVIQGGRTLRQVIRGGKAP